jgi:phosphatidylserine decarboxylase
MSVEKSRYRHEYIEQGKKVAENTEMQGLLVFLYRCFLGKLIRPLLRLSIISRFYGWYQSSSLSAGAINKFIKKHDINMLDFIVPAGGYRSFNEFFCRALTPGARSVDFDLRSLVSPADAKCWALPEVTTHATFFVKQQKFSLATLLRDEAAAEYFNGGTLFLLRLAPYDYHRFHAPLSGVYSQPNRLGGTLESVNPLAFKSGCMPLLENKRHVIMVKSEEFDCNVAVIPVGAMMVGEIEYLAPLPGSLSKADELGYFAFGGSSVIVLLPRGVLRVRADLAAYTARGFEVAVKMGESIGTFVE